MCNINVRSIFTFRFALCFTATTCPLYSATALNIWPPETDWAEVEQLVPVWALRPMVPVLHSRPGMYWNRDNSCNISVKNNTNKQESINTVTAQRLKKIYKWCRAKHASLLDCICFNTPFLKCNHRFILCVLHLLLFSLWFCSLYYLTPGEIELVSL